MIAVLSDVHGNAAALESVLTAIDEAGVERLWFLGDAVGYGGRPNECAALLQERAEIALCGNHDLACVGLISLGDFSTMAADSAKITAQLLDAQSKDWIEGLKPLYGEEDPEFGLYQGAVSKKNWLWYKRSWTANFLNRSIPHISLASENSAPSNLA